MPADLESILSEAVESQFPRKLLSWHYRSRNESLIAFSNAHYYDGRLSSFPIAPGSSTNPVELRRVDGVWEGGSRGAARVNRAEAEAVVVEVKRLLAEDPTRSIGVVTFNSQQRDLVLDLLESDPDQAVADRLQSEDEPLFVKNLENVQGDERDVIVFTLAFSEDERGRIPLNWGPLTRAGGERRLNVAITRAKERVVVVTVLRPREARPVGVDLPRAERPQGLPAAGVRRAHHQRAVPTRRPRRPSRRRRRGAGLTPASRSAPTWVCRTSSSTWPCVRPVSSRWLALLLDGPAWASRLSVGDRETLPTSVLTRMGWTRVERVWLPTWLRSRDRVVETLVDDGSRRLDDAAVAAGATAGPPRCRLLSLHRRHPLRPPRRLVVPPAASSTPVAAVAPTRRAEPVAAPTDLPTGGRDPTHGAGHLDSPDAQSRALVRTEIDGAIAAEGADPGRPPGPGRRAPFRAVARARASLAAAPAA